MQKEQNYFQMAREITVAAKSGIPEAEKILDFVMLL